MKKKGYNLHFVRVGTDEQATTIIKKLVKHVIQKELDKYGAVSHNLDEVLDKYIGRDPVVRKVDSVTGYVEHTSTHQFEES